ncbi:MAG: amidohydrolase family protein [Vicinamibacteria bacterium]
MLTRGAMGTIGMATLGLCVAAATSQAAELHSGVLALDHVAVVDVRSGAVATDRMLVVTAGRISAVARSGEIGTPPGAVVLDATGKVVIPGLWDMHVHLHDSAFLELLVAEGITGVREMGGDPALIGDWRDRIAAGRLMGPRIVMAGRILDGPDPTWPRISYAIRNAEEGRRLVQVSKRDGSDFIKVYNGLSREAYFAILSEAKQQGLTVAGHVPFSISAAEASDAGQRSIEHVTGVLEGCTARPNATPASADREWFLMNYDPLRADSLFARFARNGTWQVPTLVLKRTFAWIREIAQRDDTRLRFIPARISDRWDPGRDFRLQGRRPEYFALQQRLFKKDLALVGDMRRAGVRFLAGTDLGNPYIFPGFSLHDELGLLVQAGLTPLEALQAATLRPAEFLGESDSLGTVEPGKAADFVLLDANPLEDIANTQRIDAVCVKGTLLGRATLARMLSEVEATARAR